MASGIFIGDAFYSAGVYTVRPATPRVALRQVPHDRVDTLALDPSHLDSLGPCGSQVGMMPQPGDTSLRVFGGLYHAGRPLAGGLVDLLDSQERHIAQRSPLETQVLGTLRWRVLPALTDPERERGLELLRAVYTGLQAFRLFR